MAKHLCRMKGLKQLTWMCIPFKGDHYQPRACHVRHISEPYNLVSGIYCLY
ncbi:LOW QUALITY PROTEIN: hypothetical protein SPRG_15989 [Saprolegnia parasitica CBS 223.65]|uniref:Uncharacterized protein n=1 Tax=Saprolegnia parasitica (strain CBS 223.65) TaxID=695850 RepID=A0A067BKL5_SAPPC|nr:LOW QUALITY PROTEIN: hypothetical protein SPRG_15989 [Saprolegnia parasitica CBS 223.65]KDO18708.1 LOW QUALITY PROTEIN: hypothetical protein SPRG_15989 [Saprolegnia parasitica CBS 223.65]|eukprot:XP_012210585.1 LOW QUALITY PROTEIN: hypothetical protein SPRG_15989 [Saprolegnia parasitica CBS 223.65]